MSELKTKDQEPTPYPPRSWHVLLIGGASGTGKTTVSYRIARHFGVGITEIDDFQVILQTMTTPEQQPALHYWRTHPEAVELPPEEIVDLTIASARVMMTALEAVVHNHLESRTPIVLEGDYMLPALAQTSDRVRGVWLHEDDEAQLTRNFSLREPEAGDQSLRARVSWLYGNWLKQEAEKIGVAVVASRPWETTFERVLKELERKDSTQRRKDAK